jgi:hypothetical protein
MEEILVTIGLSLFPAGILSVIVLGLFKERLPQPIGAFLTLVALVGIWGGPVLALPCVGYEFVVRTIANSFGFELPSLLF